MKKIFCILFSFTVLFTLAFADKSRFYEDGKVIDTMYVDSEDGLKVRDYPSLKSKRLCGLSHRFPVKVVAIGKEETIDEITAPWVEILIPQNEWKGNNPEYGWVFGGYLAKKLPEFKKPETAGQFKQYLEDSYWRFWWEDEAKLDEGFASECIKAGISATGTKYEQQYHDYWNPIMAEQQKKADKIT